MDTVSPETRSRMMAAIHSHGTAPELLVRRFLRAEGWRYRVCDRRIAGRPDIVLPRARAIVEIHGCFWHRHGWEWDGRKLVWTAFCPEATGPQTHRAFWNAKFRANVRRDAARRGALAGGRVGEHRALDLRTWEKTPRNDLAWLSRTLAAWKARCGG